MKKTKKLFYCEAAYLFGLIFLALGTALVEKAAFGVSMVVAPAYLVHLKLCELWSFVTFGVAEYFLQAVLIILCALAVRRFKLSYFFTFVTALLYGFLLDMFIALLAALPADIMAARIALYTVGIPVTSLGVAFMFHTYISPEAYELLVKELCDRYKLNMGVVKTVYDLSSLICAVIMSFAFFGFGSFRGIGVGTLIAALCNGTIIGLMGRYMDKHFVFKDRFALRKYFE